MSLSIVSKKPNLESQEADIERLRISIAAIHCRLISADLTKDTIVQIIRECEVAIPDLRAIREHAWSNHRVFKEVLESSSNAGS